MLKASSVKDAENLLNSNPNAAYVIIGEVIYAIENKTLKVLQSWDNIGEFTKKLKANSSSQILLSDEQTNVITAHTGHITWDLGYVGWIARSIPISAMAIPNKNDKYGLFYSLLAKAQAMVMTTHIFDLKGNKFQLYFEYNNYRLSKTIPDRYQVPVNEFWLFLNNNKIYGQSYQENPIEITSDYIFNKGIPEDIYLSVFNKLKTTGELLPHEKIAINKYINASGKNKFKTIGGEGASGNLMSQELKKAFTAYQVEANSKEVDQLAGIINNFGEINEVDIAKLEYGKYQAIKITTEFNSSSSHAESILTDGRLLFWINRGGDTSGDDPGIKVFKVIKNISEVKNVLAWMKTGPYPETQTRVKIHALLKEDGDKTIPSHIHISMPAQIVGNCSWAQSESMVKAAAIVNRLRDIDVLKDDIYKSSDEEYAAVKTFFTESQKWQKVLKDSDDIYQDFIANTRAKKLESILFSMNKEFYPSLLNKKEQEQINNMRQASGNPITYHLLVSLSEAVKKDLSRFSKTKYEKAVSESLNRIDLEIALGSKMGEALQRARGVQNARDVLKLYQKNQQNSFIDLSKIYEKIEKDGVFNKRTQDEIFTLILNSIIAGKYQYFLTQKCLKANWFVSLEVAKKQIRALCLESNEVRKFDLRRLLDALQN